MQYQIVTGAFPTDQGVPATVRPRRNFLSFDGGSFAASSLLEVATERPIAMAALRPGMA